MEVRLFVGVMYVMCGSSLTRSQSVSSGVGVV